MCGAIRGLRETQFHVTLQKVKPHRARCGMVQTGGGAADAEYDVWCVTIRIDAVYFIPCRQLQCRRRARSAAMVSSSSTRVRENPRR